MKRNYPALAADLTNRVRQNFRLARALPGFLQNPITLAEAREEIQRSLENREARFLRLMRARVYDRPDSPYLKLLDRAGCGFSDLAAGVRRDGLEGALAKLAREGVYLTADEFKGKIDVVRGKLSFRVSPGAFLQPGASAGFMTQSSGTSNTPIPSIIPLDRIAVQTWEVAVFYAAHDLFERRHAAYDAVLPAGGGLRNLLINAKLGIATERWFARKVPSKTVAGAWYSYWNTRFVVEVAKRYGPGFPTPEYIGIEDIGRIVGWISQKRSEGGRCCIKTAASNAARIAAAAHKTGVSLQGVKFIVGGEPFTEAKRDAIQRAGATATPHYGFSTGGSVGNGCGNPVHADEVHVNRHTFAVIVGPEDAGRGAAVRPFLFTTLLSSDPRLLLNVENGDYGILEERGCGCALEEVGLTVHLHHVRSYEKFTSEGMNYYYGDLYEFFETTLPAEFGGAPGDYQLVEEEDENGQTRLTLRVDPDLADIDEEKILRRVSARLGAESWAKEFQARVWQAAGTLRILREPPHTSARGKILPLHIAR